MSGEEVRALREELRGVRNLVLGLEARLELLEQRLSGPESLSARQVSGSSDGFSVVSSAAGAQTSSAGFIATDDTEGRVALAKGIGGFLRRAYDGVHRGASDRERLKLANRLYVILVDFEGRRFPEPKVSERFAEVREICKRGPDTGESVFVGFATQWEAKLAVKEAGFTWPSQRRDG